MNNLIYKISAKSNFFKELALGIISKEPLIRKLKSYIVILPTKIACMTLKETFKELNIPCPIIQAIGDLSFIAGKNLKNNMYLSKIGMINKISKLILTMNISGFNSIFAATELAEYFSNLLHRLDLYRVSINDLQQIISEDLDLHKQQISKLLESFVEVWKQNYSLTKTGYSNLLIEEFTKNIGNRNIIIAGINSNIPIINNLLLKAYRSPNCKIILYGLDEHLNEDDWNNIDKNHPQYNFKSLFQKLSITQDNIIPWHSNEPSSLFISQALRPARSCNNWHKLSLSDCKNIQYISLTDQHREAKAILNIIKEQTNKTIMIITNDESLTIKLMQHLKSINIDLNIVRDNPLSSSKSTIWLKLCLNFMLKKHSILSSLALFKHPFSSIDSIELEALIRSRNFFGNNIFDTKSETLDNLLNLAENFNKHASFKELLTQHIIFAESTSNQDLWSSSDGEELKLYLDQLIESSEHNSPINLQEYSLLFDHFLKSAFYREQSETRRITLIKPIDARLHSADIIILAGLNHSIWPSKAIIDPCFNQFSLEKIGLPSPKQAIGEETHDFYCFTQASQVFLTRAEKINGTITTESPWISRLRLLSRDSIKIIDNLIPSNIKIKENTQTITCPPVEYRPKQLSVTQIEKLIFNPYHIYVDLILKLKKLPPLNRNISALDFGNFIHKSLAIYHSNRKESLINAGLKALKQLGLNQESIKMLWWPRFLRIAKWFLLNENTKAKIFLEDFGKIKIGSDFTIIAIADRLEILNNNSVNIIDYKTGKLSSSKSITTGKKLQLLLEALIALDAGFSCQKTRCNQINSLSYIQLSGGEDPAEILEINIEDNEIIEKTKEYLIELIKEYQNPLTPYSYTKKKTLGYCEYSHLSGMI
jgi:ATP-dependent helicase/nuclease subunit B